jgi:hypothetical protein
MSIFTNSASRSVEEASGYTAAVLDLLGARDPFDVLRTTPPALRALIGGTPPDLLTRPEAPGKWSIAMVTQHLADSDLVWGWRVRLILAQDRPVITGYDQDAWATRLRYDEVPIEHALNDFEGLRGSNLRLLERMPEADRLRVGVHAERGEESIAHLIRLYAGHDILHLRQIERIRKQLG